MITLPIQKASNNPAFGLVVIVVIAGVLTLVSYLLFAKSAAYVTVRQLHNAVLNEPVDLGVGVDTTSPVKSSDIDTFGASVEKRVNNFDDQSNFGIGVISEELLGY